MDLPAWALRGWMIGEGIDRAHADAVARLFLSEPPVSTFRPAFRLPQTESGAVPLVLARVPALTIELELGGIARLDDRAVLVADLEVPPPTSPDDSDPSVLLAIHTSTPLSDALPLLGSVRAVGHQRALLALSTPDGPEAFGVVRVELDEIPVADAGDCDATFGVLVSQLPEPEWDRGAPDCAPPQAASLARVIPSLCK